MSKHVILAAAGARKTEDLIQSALSVKHSRVYLLTYTIENQNQIRSRILSKVGTVPENIRVMGWCEFLISECIKPYQSAFTKTPFFVRGMNFDGRRHDRAKKSSLNYFFDSEKRVFRDGLSDLAVLLNNLTSGRLINRLQQGCSHIFIDEFQDLVGFDLEFIDLLLDSNIHLMLVGDPRQRVLETSRVPKNKKYRGVGIYAWLKFPKRAIKINHITKSESYRCNQSICDFADSIFPGFPPTTSMNNELTGHDGIFQLCISDVDDYIAEFPSVQILRRSRSSSKADYDAMNFGVAKGSTFDRVIIYPTKSMERYLIERSPEELKEPERLYVAVTRARFSVAFVVDKPLATNIPVYKDRERPFTQTSLF